MKSAGRRSLAWAVSMVPALVLALLSSLLTHQIAYLATQPLVHDGHTHVAWRWALLLPLLLLGISWAVVRHLRDHGHRRVSTVGVATLGLLLFLGQETVEIIRAGGSAPQAIRSPGVLAGALLLAPIAAVLVRCLRGVAGLVQRLLGPPDARPRSEGRSSPCRCSRGLRHVRCGNGSLTWASGRDRTLVPTTPLKERSHDHHTSRCVSPRVDHSRPHLRRCPCGVREFQHRTRPSRPH